MLLNRQLTYIFFLLFLFSPVFISNNVAAPVEPSNEQLDLELELAFPNLSFQQPLGLVHANDGTNRLFVVEKRGVIYVFENSLTTQSAEIFLDISARVRDDGYEEGLLGLAFHPDYESNGYFYVDYTASNPRRTVVSRFSVSPGDENSADSTSEQVILEVEQPYSNHNGGQLAFGPDGLLYIALGDGGDAGDPHEHGQNKSTLLGSILRISVDETSDGKNYAIPEDNPFAGSSTEGADEIFAYGFRNPWRFSWDYDTESLWAGDVGQSSVEEIDIVENGKNYGWNIKEGDSCYSPPSGCSDEGLTDPVWTYGHDVGVSITGGFVYRGNRVPELSGKYIYGDFGTGKIWSLEYNDTSSSNNTELADTTFSISSFGVDADKNLYIVDFGGQIYQFTSTTTTTTEPTTTPTTTLPFPSELQIYVITAGLGIMVLVGIAYWYYRVH